MSRSSAAHLWFDRPVLTESRRAFLQGPLQWLFRKDVEGRSVHGVVSAARDWLDVPRDQSPRRNSNARSSPPSPVPPAQKLQRGVVVIEKRATFSPSRAPGTASARPSPHRPAGIQNLYLAGDYTRTGWPATMEGAVRSGYLAAEGNSCGTRRDVKIQLNS